MKVGKDALTPVRGEAAPTLSVSGSPVVAASAKALSQPEMLLDLDQFLSAVAANEGTKLPTSLARIAPPPKSGAAAFSKAISEHLSGSLGDLSKIYADGLVTEDEMMSLGRIAKRLDDVLSLRDGGALTMLPKPVRARLESLLFAPLAGLVEAATTDKHDVLRAVELRDLEPFGERIVAPTAFQTLDLDAVLNAGPKASIHGLDRYRSGDVLQVPRSDGSTTLGVVVGKEPNGNLRVEVSAGGDLGLRTSDAATVRAANPLKIGDYLPNFEGKEFWIKGSADGTLSGTARNIATQAVVEIDSAQVLELAGRIEEALLAARAEGRTSLLTHGVPVAAAKPKADASVLLRAGGAQTVKVETLDSASAKGGLFTSRGPTLKEHGVEYASYNEDAALLAVTPSQKGDVWVAGAFDQAGGMGKIPGQDGAASRIAAEHLQGVAKQIVEGAEPKDALRAAVKAAHTEICKMNKEHGVEAITTVAGGVVIGDRAFVVNSGDSQIYQYAKDGSLKAMSLSHNLGDELIRKSGDPNAGLKHANIVTTALGIDGEKPKIDLYDWKLAPGDYLVFVSDGISDANHYAQLEANKTKKNRWTQSGGDKVAEDLGQILKKKPSAEKATGAIRDYALSQMKNELGKQDNTTVVVIQKT